MRVQHQGNFVLEITEINFIYLLSNFQYNKQHLIPLEDIKLQSLDDEGSKFQSSMNLKSPICKPKPMVV